jgi:hypothetical protein
VRTTATIERSRLWTAMKKPANPTIEMMNPIASVIFAP